MSFVFASQEMTSSLIFHLCAFSAQVLQAWFNACHEQSSQFDCYIILALKYDTSTFILVPSFRFIHPLVSTKCKLLGAISLKSISFNREIHSFRSSPIVSFRFSTNLLLPRNRPSILPIMRSKPTICNRMLQHDLQACSSHESYGEGQLKPKSFPGLKFGVARAGTAVIGGKGHSTYWSCQR